MDGLFKFIGRGTTVGSLFLCLFGMTAFFYMISGTELDMKNVHDVLSGVPNPLEFMHDAAKVYNYILSKGQLSMLEGLIPVGDNIFSVFFNFFKTFIRVFSWIGAVLMMIIYIVVLFPIYIVYYCLRLLAITLMLMGVESSDLGVLTWNWNIMSYMFPSIA